MNEDFSYDPELESDEFWNFLKQMFDSWEDEENVNNRVVIDTSKYKISMYARGQKPDEVIIRIVKR